MRSGRASCVGRTVVVNGLRAEGGLMSERNEGFQGDAEDTISVVKEIRVLVKGLVAAQAQAAPNTGMDATCDTIECPNCGAEFSVDCECPICKGHWLRRKQHQ